jgi:methionyl-tRNA formyltransferase
MKVVFFGNGSEHSRRILECVMLRDTVVGYYQGVVPAGELAELKPDIGVSASYRHIFKKDAIDVFPKGIVNMHPAYLPYNRGAYPNVWAIIDGTPAGATIHRIDEGIDTGPILVQSRVEVLPTDTGQTLYQKCLDAGVALFERNWEDIKDSRIDPIPQGTGTRHDVKDVKLVDRIRLDEQSVGLLDLIRARTYEGYPGAYFMYNGKRIYLSLSLEEG